MQKTKPISKPRPTVQLLFINDNGSIYKLLHGRHTIVRVPAIKF